MAVQTAFLKRALLAAVALVGTALVAELALRWLDYRYSPMTIRSREALEEAIPATAGDARALHLFKDRHFEYDPRLLWRPVPGRSVFNALGYRGPELERRKRPGELRLLAVGDSNTLGWSGERGPNWPEDLGQLLSRAGLNAAVINGGVWGYSAFQGEERLRDLMRFEPDLVLISFGGNDAHPVLVSDADYARRLGVGGPAWLSRLKLGQLAISGRDRLLSRPRGSRDFERALVPRVPLDEYRVHLRTMAQLARDRGATAVFLTRPYRGVSSDPTHWRTWAPGYRQATLTAAGESNGLIVDIYEEFKFRRRLFKDESHFTGLGHRLAAKFVHDRIASIVSRRLGIERSVMLAAGSPLTTAVAIQLGTATARRFLRSGFAAKEVVRNRRAAKNNRAKAVIELGLEPTTGGYEVRFDARPFRRKQPVPLTVRLNGTELGKITIGAPWRNYALTVPPGLLLAGVNHLELLHGPVTSSGVERFGVVLYSEVSVAPEVGSGDEPAGVDEP